jgi:proline iminopeptidase
VSPITVPTLILVGEQDELLEPSREMHRRIPGSRFVLIKDSGHGTNMFRPEAFIKGTIDFLTATAKGEDVAGEFVME